MAVTKELHDALLEYLSRKRRNLELRLAEVEAKKAAAAGERALLGAEQRVVELAGVVQGATYERWIRLGVHVFEIKRPANAQSVNVIHRIPEDAK